MDVTLLSWSTLARANRGEKLGYRAAKVLSKATGIPLADLTDETAELKPRKRRKRRGRRSEAA
jgi:hypothetical protein